MLLIRVCHLGARNGFKVVPSYLFSDGPEQFRWENGNLPHRIYNQDVYSYWTDRVTQECITPLCVDLSPLPPRQTGLIGNSDLQLEVKVLHCFQNTRILNLWFLLAVNKYMSFFFTFRQTACFHAAEIQTRTWIWSWSLCQNLTHCTPSIQAVPAALNKTCPYLYS